MPIFLVHIDDGAPATPPLRLAFRDALAARKEATAYAGEMLREQSETFWASQPWRVTVTDEATGAVLFVITVEGHTLAASGKPAAD